MKHFTSSEAGELPQIGLAARRAGGRGSGKIRPPQISDDGIIPLFCPTDEKHFVKSVSP
jgi:hypothetical protein